MDPVAISLTCLALVLVLLALRVPIAFALGTAAVVGFLLFFGWRPGSEPHLGRALRPALSLLASAPFEFIHRYEMSMIPLFIALGHIAYQADITRHIYDAIRVWLARLPGGLAMASVVGCGGFSAITGSSVACASAMGRIAVPEMLRHGYAPALATGSVAAGGTLGSLIPPSLLFVLYGVFTEESVSKLFLAGIVPGVLSLLGFLLSIAWWVGRHPHVAPAATEHWSRAERWRALLQAWPAVLLFVLVVGGIYLGVFTPTEAAAVSVCLALLIGWATRKLTWAGLGEALRDTAVQTATIFAIAIGAKLLVSLLSLTGLAPALLHMIEAVAVSDALVLAALVVLYLVLGMFLDSIGILLLTLPLTVPLVDGMGMDLIWFGVIVVKLLEIGLITPPIGLNVFVIHGVLDGRVRLEDIFRGVSRFLVVDLLVLLLLLLFPVLSLFIPQSMG
jgi:tripartite ATP-independent transporter DctM subunit